MKEKVTILGLGETGLASAHFLARRGYEVFVSDHETSDALERRAALLEADRIPYELGRHTWARVSDCDWVLVSPGVPPASEVYRLLQERGIRIVSEVEVASWFSTSEVIAVTGTSGKSTVTTLVARLFQANGEPCVACGNLGNPWIGEIDRLMAATRVILEASSFQLLHTYSLRPRIGILLNLGLNHLDWHPSMQDYVAAKLRLFANQTAEDCALVRRIDQENYFPAFRFKGRVVYFGEEEGRLTNEDLLYEITRLKGWDPGKTKKVLETFEGLEHRLERVAERERIQFVNDSKCTTLEALVWALDQFPDQKVILLAGGHAKGADFRAARERLSLKAKQVVVYGEAQDLLRKSWEGSTALSCEKDLPGAFRKAVQLARPGDVVLLSPACASFDQFTNYQARGKLFKEMVRAHILARPIVLSDVQGS